MKTIRIIAASAAVLVLAACQAGDEPASEDTSAPEVATTEPMAPDGLPPYGVFKLTSASGETMMENVKQDGTMINVVKDVGNVPGTWEYDADGNFCVTMEGGDGTDCYAESMVDGTWTATNIEDPEDVWTIERVMGSEALPTQAAE